MAQTVDVELRPDYIQHLQRISPLGAIEELIWNALDADASEVDVSFRRNPLGGLDEIRVADDGTGIPYERAEQIFRGLGGSWKKTTSRTKNAGRAMHGKDGKGRFAALRLGGLIEWRTRCLSEGKLLSYSISLREEAPGRFLISDAEQDGRAQRGTQVVVRALRDRLGGVCGESSVQKLEERLALYLMQDPGIRVRFDGMLVDPASAQIGTATFDVEARDREGEELSARMDLVEWGTRQERKIFLCDPEGFSIGSVSPRIHAPSVNFTAYLRSDAFRNAEEQGLMDVLDLDPGLSALVDSARDTLRRHFKDRAEGRARRIIERWKDEAIYPYEGAPATPLEAAERQVFDIVALNVNDLLPTFESFEAAGRKLSLRLLREAIRERPESLERILEDVFQLSTTQRQELAQLLDRTSLSAIVSAAGTIGDRLHFLSGLKALVFDEDLRAVVKERSQLHRILRSETWIFGERFGLANSDETLTRVLREHLRARRDEVVVDGEVHGLEGGRQIPDLVLTAAIPQPDRKRREYLVVELKRPSCKIDSAGIAQIEKYALAVGRDDRFDKTETTWQFWAVSSALDDHAQARARQRDRPPGLVTEFDSIQVWVKTWAQIVNECEARLSVFSESLEFDATHDSGLDYLRKLHGRYLPDEASEEGSAEPVVALASSPGDGSEA